MSDTDGSSADHQSESDPATTSPQIYRGKNRAARTDPRLIAKVGSEERIFYFDFAVPLLGMCAAIRFAAAFQGLQKSFRRYKDIYLGLSAWLHWIAEYGKLIEADQGAVALVRELHERIKEGNAAKMEPVRYRRVCDLYAEYMAFSEDEYITSGTIATRKGYVGSISVFLSEAGAAAGLPVLPGRFLGFPKYVPNWMSPSLPTLAEVTSEGRVDWSNPDQAADLVLEKIGQADQSLSLASKLDAIRSLNTIRLAALRRALELELEEAYSRFLFGRELLARSDIPTVETWYQPGDRDGGRGFYQWLWQLGADTPEKQLSLILKHLVAISGQGPLQAPHEFLANWVRRSRLLLNFAGLQRLNSQGDWATYTSTFRSLVSLTVEAWNAALGILLIDTSGNVQPLIDLPVDCFVGGRTADGKQVLASSKVIEVFKTRAGHDVRAVLSECPREEYAWVNTVPQEDQKYSGVRVVEIVQEMTRGLRPQQNEGRLLICAHGSGSGTPASNHQIALWKEFLKRPAVMNSPEIRGLPITRRMIRKTCLDIHAASHGNDHRPVQYLAGHASGQTTLNHYMRAPWFQMALMRNIRRFQTLLESAFLADLPGIATALGMSEEQLLKSKNLAHETGLGFVCLRPFDGVQPGTEAGQRCSYLDRCHLGCPVRRFVPNETSVLALLLTNRSLRAAEPIWIAENPQRWERTWIVLLAETEAYIARLRESSFRLVLRQAEDVLETSLASGALELVEVW